MILRLDINYREWHVTNRNISIIPYIRHDEYLKNTMGYQLVLSLLPILNIILSVKIFELNKIVSNDKIYTSVVSVDLCNNRLNGLRCIRLGWYFLLQPSN